MLGIDNLTLLLLTGLAHVLLAFMLLFARKAPNLSEVLHVYALSHLVFCFAYFLIFGRRFGESFWFISLPNALVTLAFALLAQSIALFFKWSLARFILQIFMPVILVQLFLRNIGLAEHVRLAWAVILASSPQFLLSYVYWRNRQKKSPLLKSLVAINLFLSLLFIVRIIESAKADSSYGFFHAGIGQELGLLAIYLNVIFNGFGFLLVLNENADEELRRLTTLDPMTQVLNRQSFLSSAYQRLNIADRDGQPLTLVMCQFSHLHEVNYEHGQRLGDEKIKLAVRCLKMKTQANDVLGRWHGDQLIALLAIQDIKAAQEWAHQMYETFIQLSAESALESKCEVQIILVRYRRHEDFQLTLQRLEETIRANAGNLAQHVIVNAD